MIDRSKDSGRNNLITHFHCVECGNQLNMSYDCDNEVKLINKPHDEQTEREPSGGFCMYNRIKIWPCRSCIEKYTGPANKLLQALKEIKGLD